MRIGYRKIYIVVEISEYGKERVPQVVVRRRAWNLHCHIPINLHWNPIYLEAHSRQVIFEPQKII